MHINSNLPVHYVSLFLYLFILWPMTTFAHNPIVKPIEIQLVAARTAFKLNESCQTILTLNNIKNYSLTNVGVQLKGQTFSIIKSKPLSDTIAPYSSVQTEYVLKSRSVGSQNVIFTIKYSWHESDTGIKHSRIETVSIEKLEVKASFAFNFNWPNYLIPLLIGFIIGQCGSWFSDWRKERKVKREQTDQAKGITHATLQAVRKGIEMKQQVSFALWEEAIVKGNLYSALHELGRKNDKPDLAKQMAELSISLNDYNDRLDTKNLEDTSSLVSELSNLIQVIENIR